LKRTFTAYLGGEREAGPIYNQGDKFAERNRRALIRELALTVFRYQKIRICGQIRPY